MPLKLDLTDKKILQELDLNARISTTQLARKLQINRETANYKINNLIKKGVIRKFVTMTNPAKFGYCIYKMYLKFQNLTKEIEKEIYSWLTHNDFIYWVASCKGKWDINFAIFSESINHFDKTMADFFEKYSEFVYDQEFNTTLFVGVMNKRWILPTSKIEKMYYFGGDYKDSKLDPIDLELLKILANHGRMNANEIARKMKSSSRIVLYRMKELEKKKVILGYTTSLNLDILNKQFFKTMIYFKTFNNSVKNKIIEFSRKNPNINYFVSCVGNWPIELEIIVDDNNQFYNTMDEFQKNVPEMKGYDFIIFPKEYKFDWVPHCYNI
jgi:DNA-binding Lrp family transcriptional regulator